MPPGFPVLWREFWDWVELHGSGASLFRGQPEMTSIRPRIGRPEYGYDRAREREMLNAFMRAARPFVAAPLASQWEWLALAQHHGAPTRLTDWSTSPLVAAWFAVTSFPQNTDAAIYALSLARPEVEVFDIVTQKTSDGARFEDPFAITKGVYLIETAPVSARITTQRGIFTVHGVPTTPLEIPVEQVFSIPHAQRNDFQGRLLDLGIDASHIFPDLDGLCRTLDWRLRSGRGFSSLT